MLYLPDCPFCEDAFLFVEELRNENPEFAELVIDAINEKEEPEVAGQYDYYFVPTYYVDGVKVHEGICDKELIESVLRAALAD